MQDYTLPGDHVLVVRCCASDLTAHGGFKWPESGPVEAPDWIKNNECGNGLHGWLWGVGNYSTSPTATGDSGHASATGKDAIAVALGSDAVVKTGENGALISTYVDSKKRRRVVVGYVGEKGIKANTEYVVKGGKFVLKK